MPLYDHHGNVVSTADLKGEVAGPTTASVRSVWAEPMASGLRPETLALTLKEAARGYPDRFLVLAEEMEERDLHYASVLATRKRAITGVEPIVVSASEEREDEKIAEHVKEVVEDPAFIDDLTGDLLDGLGKGYAAVEIMWDKSSEWRPSAYRWRDPRHFVIDQTDGRTLRIKDESDINGVPIPPFKFATHMPKLKSGLPIRGGLARLAIWAFMFKSYTLRDWAAFLEVYGMPLRVGKYGPTASAQERGVLLRAVRDLSTDAAAIIPKGMEIEFVAAKGGTGNAVYGENAEYLDRQISKGVLGQTMTTDDGSSLAQANVHENVRHDIAKADSRQVCVPLNRDVIRPFVDLNYGPRDRYPTVVIPITEAEDIKALADVVTKLVPLGVEIGAKDMRERIGFEDPADGEKLLSVRGHKLPDPQGNEDSNPTPEPDLETETEPENDKGKETARVCPGCGKRHETAEAQTGELNALVDAALSDWQPDIEPLLKPVREAFEAATSYGDLKARLDAISSLMDAEPLAGEIARLMLIARGLGDSGRDG